MASAQVIIDAVVAINGTVSRSYGVVSSVSTRPEGPPRHRQVNGRGLDSTQAAGRTVSQSRYDRVTRRRARREL